MKLLHKYLPFWPIFAATAVFFLLGLWAYLVSERAMERSPKPREWVRRYRRTGFPCRPEMLPAGRVSVPALLGVVLFAILYQLLIRANSFYLFTARLELPELSLYTILVLAASAVGAAAVYLSLHVLYYSTFAAFWGSMLFAASPLYTHGVVSLLACTFLFLLLYLRAEKPGLPAEFLYLAAALFLALVIAVCPPAVWLVPVLAAAHVYKLIWQAGTRRLSLPGLILILPVTLVCWLVFAVLAALVRQFIFAGFPVDKLFSLLTVRYLRWCCSWLLFDTRRYLFTLPRLGLFVNPMLDAPLLGFGFWGAVSAVGMVAKRRSARGVIALAALLALGLTWFFTARYLLPLGFAITVGALLKNADLGKRKLSASLFCGLGLLYDFGILAAAWALPLYIDLVCRLIRY